MERVGEKEKAIDLNPWSYRFSSVLELKKTKQNKTKQNKINQPKWRAFPQQGTNVAMPSNHIDEMARRRRKQKDVGDDDDGRWWWWRRFRLYRMTALAASALGGHQITIGCWTRVYLCVWLRRISVYIHVYKEKEQSICKVLCRGPPYKKKSPTIKFCTSFVFFIIRLIFYK